ncbi:MAG: class I SAM-dependent methyltransferase [Pseudomonadota bacterium]
MGSANLDGYITGSAYPTSINFEFSPAWIAHILRRGGRRPPPVRGPIRLLDIGCGDGITLASIAAAYPEGQFVGLDAMEEHIQRGQTFAKALGISNVELRQGTFEDALARMPEEFDYITCQGVIAWVSPENRTRVLDLAARSLAPGGVFAVGYNSMPGWTDRMGLQHLIRIFGDQVDGTPSECFKAALDQIQALANAGAPVVAAERIEDFLGLLSRFASDYFPHEYLNHYWAPIWSADLKGEMARRDLSFAAQINYERFREDFCLKAAQRAGLEGLENPLLRDTAIDVLCNTAFRIDLYLRDPVEAPYPELMRDAWITAPEPAESAQFEARTAAGRLKFDNAATRGVLDVLSSGPCPVATLLSDLDLSEADILNALDSLSTGNQILPAVPTLEVASAAKINAMLKDWCRNGSPLAVDVQIGQNGPLRLSPNELMILGTEAEEIFANAEADVSFRERVFHEDADFSGPEILDTIKAAQAEIAARLARQGLV